ncbi:cation-translocating P-type ATPase [Marinicella sp. W31]|uniref:cation-translocating P-type ATPase n=1 Tax=Marinicella sp. W31 TaxID=3023713 RepID=UPI0037566E72
MQYHKQTKDSLFAHFKTQETGLTSAQTERRLVQHGLNQLKTQLEINYLKLFLRQFKSFIIYILLFAICLSVFVGEYLDASIIFIILFINALIGFFQELSAQKSLEALKKINISHARVMRDGQIITLDAKYLVPGDIIQVEAGDRIPADCRILQAEGLSIQEASLTGESVPVTKDQHSLVADVPIGDQKNMLFSSTIALQGSAQALVVETAMRTEIGKIAELMRSTKEELTPLQRRLDAFGKKLGFVIILICIGIMLISMVKVYLNAGLNLESMREILLVSVALAVAAVPEGLPAVVTITLSIGVKKLLRKKTLVRHMASVETLGSCHVICADKTGTLTKNEMTVKKVWSLDGEANISGNGYDPSGQPNHKLTSLIYTAGLNCNNASLYEEDGHWKISGDPTEAALLVSARKAGHLQAVQRLDSLAFDANRKRMSVMVQQADDYCIFTKGATHQILDVCTHVLINGKKEPLSDDHRKIVEEQMNQYAEQALRVLAFAYKPAHKNIKITEEQLIFLGLQAMIDPPRDDVVTSLETAEQAGINVIMITGDYQGTAEAIAEQLGINGSSLSGTDLDRMSAVELKRKLQAGVRIFARTIPQQKQKIVSALQEMGLVVAMTGDGVNDAPALKKANIGIAMGSGTDVAKEASDFVLLDDSFTHIINAIEEGRGIYDNIQKTIMLLLSGNLCEVLIVFMAVVLNWNLPLTAIMILWINLISDGAPALAFAVDPHARDIMKQKVGASSSSILALAQIQYLVTLGIIITIPCLILFHHYQQTSLMLAQTVVFCSVVIAEIALVFAIRLLYSTPQFSNAWLWLTLILSLLLQILIVYSPLAQLFKVETLPGTALLFLLSLGILVLISGSLLSRLFVSSNKYQTRTF